MEFIGREAEQRKLLRAFNTKGQNTTLVYGRRRIGKSELILHCLRQVDALTIYYECRQTAAANNVKGLGEVISASLDLPRLAFDDIQDVLSYVFKVSEDRKIVLVIDEYPYLRDAVQGMDSILQALIDTNRDHSNLSLVICGSYVETMKSLLERDNPLYGRIDLKINLLPMDYYETARFYPEFSPEDKVRLYSVFGGVPYYNRLIDRTATVRENLIELLLAPDARLEDEVSSYLLMEISKITNANEVFSAMAEGYTRYKDILSQSHVSSGPTLVNVLEKLVNMRLVQRQAPINDPQNRKKTSYIISDALSSFYYRYVFRYLSQRSVLSPEVFYERFVGDDFERRFVPHAFEEICRQYLVRQNKAGNIEPPFNLIGKYHYDDPVNKMSGEFDVVTDDPCGYIFYEAKFRATQVTARMIAEEIKQVEQTKLACYKYGFFSRSGFEDGAGDERTILIDLEQLFT